MLSSKPKEMQKQKDNSSLNLNLKSHSSLDLKGKFNLIILPFLIITIYFLLIFFI